MQTKRSKDYAETVKLLKIKENLNMQTKRRKYYVEMQKKRGKDYAETQKNTGGSFQKKCQFLHSIYNIPVIYTGS